MRRATCPNCGGPIEFKAGSSAALVCSFCSFAVVRTDRDLRLLGKVADLVPTAPEATTGDAGVLFGLGFVVAGRMQLDHGRGPWDEWYVAFEDGRWGWLAKAQGKWFATFPVPSGKLPPWEQLSPGSSGLLDGGGQVAWTVQERGGSRLVSAEGELPYPFTPGETGRFVDLVAPGSSFATIDYGSGREAPQLYVGREVTAADLQWTSRAAGPRPVEQIDVSKLKCPNCGGPVPIFVPEKTERAACSSCYALLDFDRGAFRFLEQLNQGRAQIYIPLGAEGNLRGHKVTCIGFMERYCIVEGVRYSWREYLLHNEQGGFEWIVEDNRHFTWVTTISAGDLRFEGTRPTYHGVTYRPFSNVDATVSLVLGEFYWKVALGEATSAREFVAPPFLLSEETSESEVVWSAGEYLEGKELWKAFGLPGKPPAPFGVASSQPNPHKFMIPLVSLVVFTVLFLAITFGLDWNRKSLLLVDGPIPVPSMPTSSQASMQTATALGGAPAVDTAIYTPVFQVPRGPTVLEITLNTTVDNQWVGVACALVNEDTGEVREFFLEAESFHGFTGGESWSEGTPYTTEHLDRVRAGNYSLRLEPMWESPYVIGAQTNMHPPVVQLRVVSGERGGLCCAGTFFLLLIPPLFAFYRRFRFESVRSSNSNL